MTHHILFNIGTRRNITKLTATPKWGLAPLWAGDWGFYTYFYGTLPVNPITIDWVREEQLKYGIKPHPFTFTTLGIQSIEMFTPPFHVQTFCPFNYRSDILDSVWLLNNVELNPTRELDLFESGRSWRRRLWFADHFGGLRYSGRQMDSTELLFVPNGINQADIYVYPDHAERYLNGRLIKVTHKDLNYPYWIRATLIVNTPDAKPCRWQPEIFVEKL